MKKLIIIIVYLLAQTINSQQAYQLDTSFGNNGIAMLNLGVSETFVKCQAIQTDGKILVGGYYLTYPNTKNNFVVRFNADGTLDTLFGTNGYLFLTYSHDMQIKLFSDGKFLVNSININIKKFNSNGSLDTTFGNNGVILENKGCDVVVQNDDKFIVTYSYFAGTQNYPFKIQRYDFDGVLDPTFITNNSDYGIFAKGNSAKLVLLPDGKIIVIHYVNNYGFGNILDYTLFKLNQDGSLDSNTTSPPLVHATPQFLGLQNDGKLLFKFSYYGNSTNIKRHNSDFTLDQTYGTNGVSENFPHMQYPTMRMMTDNKMLLVQSDTYLVGVSQVYYLKIHKFDSNGFYDLSFANSGTQILPATLSEKPAINMDFSDNSIYISGHEFKMISGTGYYNNSIYVSKLNLSETLNISENTNKKVRLFAPNPVNDKIYFDENVKSISIFSIDGKLINTYNGVKEINVSFLSKGIYIINAIDENNVSFSEKLIKL
jgi:uncharacterized delta-60 repeat protein